MVGAVDLFGHPIQHKEISVNVYHDEREIPDRWLYHSFLFIPPPKEKEFFDLLMKERQESGWHKEIHFVELKDTVSANKLATRWINLFGGPLSTKIYFYFFGVNYGNLEKRIWTKKTRDFKIYNRFFQIGLYGAIKWLFLNPTSGYQRVEIEEVVSDAKSRMEADRFHQQPIEEITAKASLFKEQIAFKKKSIMEVDSDHDQESKFQQASHIIQFVDIVGGAMSQTLDSTSVHYGKCECAQKLLWYGLPEKVMQYDRQHYESPYYKVYGVSFFPKKKLSPDEILSQRYAGSLFYTWRELKHKKTGQQELFEK